MAEVSALSSLQCFVTVGRVTGRALLDVATKNSAVNAVEFYMVDVLLTLIFISISIPSPPHSFIPGLKPSFSANPSHHFLFFFQD